MTTVTSPSAPTRWAWAAVDPAAVRHNVEVLRCMAAPSDVWAVVKADGYGHGDVDVARAALEGGAAGLCVALVDEGVRLREHGIDAPVLVFGEQPAEAVPDLVRHGLSATAYTVEYVETLADAARSRGVRAAPVHVNVDTGMQRVGARPDEAADVIGAVLGHTPELRLGGVYTHLAVADEPADPATADQLARFDALLAVLGIPHGGDDAVAVHVANSAGALAHPTARRTFVRAGIAVYGISPGPAVDHLCRDLRPAMSLRARVSFVKRVRAGSRISYGLRHTFTGDTTVATVPIGYADGVPRRLYETGGEVLLAGRRRPIVGVVTMDQLMVDCGDDDIGRSTDVGDEVVLIGEQTGPAGSDRIRAEEWAARLGTIGYEIVCGVGPRVPRIVGPSIVARTRDA